MMPPGGFVGRFTSILPLLPPPFHFFHQSSKCCFVPSGSTRQELRKKKEKTKMWGGRFRKIESNGIDIPFFFNLIETTERSTSAMADDDDRA